MDRSRSAERARREIERLCHAGLDGRSLTLEALRHLRRVVPVDAFWCATVDPATVLFTGTVKDAIPEYATPYFLANEFFQDDVNKFADLARSTQPVNSLFEAAGGEPAQSARYRDILVEIGFGDELRAALTVGGACWGVMCLHRELAGPGFAPSEIDFLRRLRPHLAHGLRTALLLENAVPDGTGDGPGLVMLSDELELIAATPTARRWLEELADWPPTGELPQAILAVAARLQALEHAADTTPTLMPRARIRARSGQWLMLHASRLAGPGARGQIAIILEVARPIEVAPLVLEAYELTPRERETATLVLGGRSTDQIAAELCISPLTVQQHLKAVFDKVGVRSRRELVAQLFARHYAPRIAAGRIAAGRIAAGRIGTDGSFDPTPRGQ